MARLSGVHQLIVAGMPTVAKPSCALVIPQPELLDLYQKADCSAAMYYNSFMKTSQHKVLAGAVHEVPADLRKALAADAEALKAWEDITPLARNEWICWTISVKQQKTRDEHVKRVVSELKEGVRRPCCWIGCVHRPDKKISPSVAWALSRKSSIS